MSYSGEPPDDDSGAVTSELTSEVVAAAKAAVEAMVNHYDIGPSEAAALLEKCDAAKHVNDLPVAVVGIRTWEPSIEEFEKAASAAIQSAALALNRGQ